jgi:hypothetical protein
MRYFPGWIVDNTLSGDSAAGFASWDRSVVALAAVAATLIVETHRWSFIVSRSRL